MELLGSTEIHGALLLDFVIGLANSSSGGRDAFCLGAGPDFNSFSSEVAAFLCGARLPEYVGLPKDLTAAENKLLAPLLAAESLADPDTDASASVISFAKQKRRRGEPDPYLELSFQTTKTSRKEQSPELDDLEAEIQALK